MDRSLARLLKIVLLIAALGLVLPASGALGAKPVQTAKQPTAIGTGGAVATVDLDASRVGMQVLREGGNAVDATIATAAALGVTEPYSCGIGGGGFMVIYDADSGRVSTIDSRETAPAEFKPDSFIEDPDPGDSTPGEPIPFEERVTSGLGVGVPGTIRGWEEALGEFGSRPLSELLQPSIRLAARGFVVDQTYRQQTLDNLARFEDFTSTRETFLRNGQAPAVGSTFRNPNLAATYSRIADGGGNAFYSGRTARAIVNTVKNPPVVDDPGRIVRPGLMETTDLSDYSSIERAPTVSSYRGMQVYGMGPPSSGGSTVGEVLNILEGYPMSDPTLRDVALHRYLEASRYSFADRGKYLGDPAYVDVPLTGLLSDDFAAERRALIMDQAAQSPVAPGDPCPYNGGEPCPVNEEASTAVEGPSTTHLTVSDEWGNVVSYTFTIEQTGGSAITVPNHGFILNNELTDFEPVVGTRQLPCRRQASEEQHEPDDNNHQRRRSHTRARLPGRVDDHHDRAASSRQRSRLRHDPPRGHRRAPGLAAQLGDDLGRAGFHQLIRGRRSPGAATASPRRPRSGPQQASHSSPAKPCRPQPSRSAAAGEALSWRTLSAEVNRKL